MKNSKTKQPKQTRQKRAKQDIVMQYLAQCNEPTNTKAIAQTLGQVGKDGRQAAFEILEGLRDDGKVMQLSKHRWAMKHAIQQHRGRVVGHIDGHGYVLTDDTREKVFLRANDMREVLHNDIVNVRVMGRDRRQRALGKIIEVIEHGNSLVVGRYFFEGGTHFVVPDEQRIGQDIFVLPEHTAGAQAGQVVAVKITQNPSKNFQPVGQITEVLGDYLAPGMEIEIAQRKHQLPTQWPQDVLQQTKSFNEQVTESEWAGREDLRDLPLVTIDGADARDFDDAVYCQPLANGKQRLIVAIADVSSYVSQDSPLDQEAWLRGTSVYFPNNVIPMLPEALSNGLCSLNPKVNRLCFACDMVILPSGAIDSYRFYPAVMYSHARLTYSQVAALLDGDLPQANIDASLHKAVTDLAKVAQLLGQQRRRNGTIEFELPEPMIIFDAARKIERIVARPRNIAHRLIEECMLAANICASLMLSDSDLAGIYRVHDAPEQDKIADVKVFLRQFKLLLEGGDAPTPKHFSALIDKVDDPLVAKIVQTALLRSMQQARYDVDNDGHFALNFDSYTHFTSPIRRYSDLLVHRQIKRLLQDPAARDDEQTFMQVAQTAEQASMTERRAEAASREVIQWLQCEFMSHKVGEHLWGVVSSVTEFGLFVELEEFYIDGLVHITSLGQDYYRYDAERRQLLGEHSGRVYTTGQRLQVQVSRVDMQQNRIDFALTDVRNDKFKRANQRTSKKSSKKSSGKKSDAKKRAQKR